MTHIHAPQPASLKTTGVPLESDDSAARARDLARQAFFDERAEQWMDMWYRDDATGTYTRHAKGIGRLFDSLALRFGEAVLDVGCGSGVLAPYILERVGPYGRLHEVDYAKRMIEVNRRLHPDPRITFSVCSAEALVLPAGSLDMVICFSCFPHFDRKQAVLDNLAGMLRGGGRFVIAHFGSSEHINDHHRKHQCVMHEHLPPEAAMRLLISHAGLSTTRFVDETDFYYLEANKPFKSGL